METVAAVIVIGILAGALAWARATYRKHINGLCDVLEALNKRVAHLGKRIEALERRK